MFLLNPWLFREPEVYIAAILDCRLIHGMLWVLQETFLKAYLLDKIDHQLSSKIQGTWNLLLGQRTSLAEGATPSTNMASSQMGGRTGPR